jgi:serine/threonine protein phosphatase PrpC
MTGLAVVPDVNFAAADHLRPFTFTSIAVTHAGCVRRLNEDAVLDRPEAGLWAVADGMGGHAAGDIASATVIRALSTVANFTTAFSFRHSVRNALLGANADLQQRADEELLDTMGATVVTMLVHRGHYACIWAGDSRAYLHRKGRLERITRDHSLVQELVDAGSIDARDARSHRNANIVTRAVGANPRLDLDGVYGSIEPGDRFLLCSDGLIVLEEPEISAILGSESLSAASKQLLATALARGAPDNVSFVLIDSVAPDR